MAFYPDERIAIYIDGSNLYSTTKYLDYDIDYKRLLELFQNKGRLIRAYYYTAIVEDSDYSAVRPLIDFLDYNGYTIRSKPAKYQTDRDGNRRVKGNMDIEIAVDMMQHADNIDHMVLFSGDGDFSAAVQAVQDKGVRVSVVSTLKSKPSMLADELRRHADAVMDLIDMKRLIGRDNTDTEH